MAQPSSSNRDREHRSEREPREHRADRTERTERTERGDRERDRERRSSRSHHHHRTVSSTTLLLVLSLVLAVLAVMLSLPSGQLPTVGTGAATPTGAEGATEARGVWGILTPKRSQALAQREGEVARREADVARREAELLAGAPGGVLPPAPPPPVSCPMCPTMVVPEPVTITREVFMETEALAPPAQQAWFKEGQLRFEDILDRELKIAEREREIGRREEQANRREHDASRREAWIMEQLIALGNEEPTVEDEFVYERPAMGRVRQPKFMPIEHDMPPLIVTETAIATEFKTVTQTQHHTHTLPSETVTVPAPANTRLAAVPTPAPATMMWATHIPRTTSVQIVKEEIIQQPEPEVVDVIVEEQQAETVTVVRNSHGRAPARAPKRWGGW